MLKGTMDLGVNGGTVCVLAVTPVVTLTNQLHLIDHGILVPCSAIE